MLVSLVEMMRRPDQSKMPLRSLLSQDNVYVDENWTAYIVLFIKILFISTCMKQKINTKHISTTFFLEKIDLEELKMLQIRKYL